MIATHNASEKRVLGCEAEECRCSETPPSPSDFCLRTEPISSSDSDLISDTAYTHTTPSLLRRRALMIRTRRCGRDNEELLATYARCFEHTINKPTHVNSLEAWCFAELFWLISTKVMPLPALQQAAQKSAEIVALRAPKLKRNTRGHGSRTERE